MGLVVMRSFFLWCTILNYGILLAASLAFLLAGDFIYRLHRRWFALERESFEAAFYFFLGFYKICILVFCLVPWLALLIAG